MERKRNSKTSQDQQTAATQLTLTSEEKYRSLSASKTLRDIVTSDCQVFSVDIKQFAKHSLLVSKELDSTDPIFLENTSSQSLRLVIRFIENRKLCRQKPINSPLKINHQDLSRIMHQCDSQLVGDVLSHGFCGCLQLLNVKYNITQAATELDMNGLLILLHAGMAMYFISQEIQQIKESFDASDIQHPTDLDDTLR